MSGGAPNFSPSLTLAGMDYIAPSAACIKPTLIKNAAAANNTAGGGGSGSGTVGVKKGGNNVLAAGAAALRNGTGPHPDVVKITLQDCLACSGCVTTAETVLVNAQSRSEIVATLLGLSPPTTLDGTAVTTTTVVADDAPAAAQRPRLVSISPQSCASLAAYLHLSMEESYALMAGFLRHALTPEALQKEAAAAAAAAEAEAAGSTGEEALSRRHHENEDALADATAAPSTAPGHTNGEDHTCSSSSSSGAATSSPATSSPAIFVISLEWAEQLSAALTAQEYTRRREEAPATLPMIVSACPGWVCYCEKQGSALLPHLCPVMSAQGIAGSYAKRTVDDAFYHISIQPCFDRKLEAARDAMPLSSAAAAAAEEEEGEEETRIFYTDCVLSTAELLEWMKEVDPTLPWRAALDSSPTHPEMSDRSRAAHARRCDNEEDREQESDTTSTPLAGPPVSTAAHDAARLAGSGSYHQSVIADRLQRVKSTAAGSVPDVRYEVKRNHNHQLATCPDLPGEVFCVGYGFQQIQNVVRGLKKKMPAMRGYTFVELMACPDGCLNGGGQVRPAQQLHGEVLDAVIDAYARHTDVEARRARHAPADSPVDAKGNEEEEEQEEEKEKLSQRRRLEPSSNVPFVENGPFADATIAAVAPALGDALWRCAFRDREKEFAEMLNAGNIHSLKW